MEIAERIGADPGPHRVQAERLHDALGSRLWDPAIGGFAVRDLAAGRLVERRTVGCLAPLLDPDLAPERVTRSPRSCARSASGTTRAWRATT